MKNQTDILIIGGGFAGVSVTQKLAKSGVDVTLVDRKNYFEVTFATLRNVANPKLLGNTPRKLYRDFLNGTFIQARVESMNDKEARLTNGETICFSRAVIASGSRYPTLPLAKSNTAFNYSERNQEMLDEHKSLASAKSVLVIGGGVVGVEFAGEIASAFPDKDVTLAHATGTLLDNFKLKAQRKALEQLTAKGVKVKFNRRFAQDGDVYRDSKSNETMRPDVAYVCVGMIPNTEFLQAELPNILDDKGLVKVDAFMKVEGYENLYSLGDCSTLDSRKHGYLAGVQGANLGDTLLKSAQGETIKPYNNSPIMIVTTTGTDSGVATLPFFGITSTLGFIVNLKQTDMGISNMYKTFGTEPDMLE
ncbi:MAG: FAD-dependent oxidoreductase [Chloroflexi bacterium]|nr:FAD-dependent oxidoreductase [Chloroflexota bacterium]